MLDTVVFRRSGEQYSQTHIVEHNLTRAFCGAALPTAVLEDTRRIYFNKGNVSCRECLTEWVGGRQTGYATRDAVGPTGPRVDAPDSRTEASVPDSDASDASNQELGQ